MQRAKTISAKRKNSKHKEVEVENAKRKSNKCKEGTYNKHEENKQ
jgi:hypothetical protein